MQNKSFTFNLYNVKSFFFSFLIFTIHKSFSKKKVFKFYNPQIKKLFRLYNLKFKTIRVKTDFQITPSKTLYSLTHPQQNIKTRISGETQIISRDLV